MPFVQALNAYNLDHDLYLQFRARLAREHTTVSDWIKAQIAVYVTAEPGPVDK